MLINPVLLAVATVIAIAAGKLLGLNPHIGPILLAASIGMVASELALLPIILGSSKAPVDVFQRAFAGTVLHLLISVILAAIAVFGLNLVGPFVFWMLGSYWITLSGLCIVFVKVLRSPSVSGNPVAKSGQLSAN
jgi:hypothetical protein